MPDAPSRLEVFQLAMDQSGSLYLYVSPAPNELNVAGLAKFDADLHYMGAAPGFWVGWDGRTCTSVGGRYPEPNDHFVVYSPDGDLDAAVTLQPPAEVSAAEYDSNLHRWWPTSGVLLDSWGGLDPGRSTPGDLRSSGRGDAPISSSQMTLPCTSSTAAAGSSRSSVSDGLPFYITLPSP